MGSHVTPDGVEKAIIQPRKAHSARGLGLLTLSFSTLGVFFASFPPFFSFFAVANFLTRYHLLGHRDLSSVCLERYLASRWSSAPKGGRDWGYQRDSVGDDIDAIVKIREHATPFIQGLPAEPYPLGLHLLALRYRRRRGRKFRFVPGVVSSP